MDTRKFFIMLAVIAACWFMVEGIEWAEDTGAALKSATQARLEQLDRG